MNFGSCTQINGKANEMDIFYSCLSQPRDRYAFQLKRTLWIAAQCDVVPLRRLQELLAGKFAPQEDELRNLECQPTQFELGAFADKGLDCTSGSNRICPSVGVRPREVKPTCWPRVKRQYRYHTSMGMLFALNTNNGGKPRYSPATRYARLKKLLTYRCRSHKTQQSWKFHGLHEGMKDEADSTGRRRDVSMKLPNT